MKLITFILSLFIFTSCISVQPVLDDNKKITPQCCRGQETHTCGMPGMTSKPLPLPKGRGK